LATPTAGGSGSGGQAATTTPGETADPGSTSSGGTTLGLEPGGESSSGDDPTFIFDVNFVPDSGAEVCDAFVVDGTPQRVPTDLVIVVDGSGSMVEEAAAVEDHLNSLVTSMVAADVDVRVVLLARASGSTGICLDAPLGSGLCPADSNEPGYRHLDVDVGSWEPLQVLIDEYPNYADMLRTGARRQLLVVSDDNSFALSAGAFEVEFEALDAWNEGFVFHAMVSHGACPDAVSPGTEYLGLADRTGGTAGDLCSSEFGQLFNALSEGAVRASESCVYPLSEIEQWPEAHEQASIEVGGLSVEQFDTAASCEMSEHGWFVDDTDSTLRLCPATCERAVATGRPELEVTVTCDLVPR
jgi:hypothetical protein